jgi:hypothetical protein
VIGYVDDCAIHMSPGFARESGQEAAANPAIPVNVDDGQPTKIEASAPHTPSAHIPDAAATFDDWALRESTSWDAPGASRRWVEAMLASTSSPSDDHGRDG